MKGTLLLTMYHVWYIQLSKRGVATEYGGKQKFVGGHGNFNLNWGDFFPRWAIQDTSYIYSML